jgi:predicted RNA-binding protein
MCQVSAFVKDGKKEDLLRENVTSLEMLDDGIRVSTLFEGSADFQDLSLHHIDFSAGRIILSKNVVQKGEKV